MDKPSIFSPKDEIFDYVVECMKTTSATEDQINYLWDVYMENNKKVINYMKELIKKERVSTERTAVYKIRVYKIAIRKISEMNCPLISSKQLKNVKGIGEKTKMKIDEIINTGKLEVIDKLSSNSTKQMKINQMFNIPTNQTPPKERIRILNDFNDIYGVGKKRAQELYDLGYRSIDELPLAIFNDKQRIGVKYYYDFLEQIPREDIQHIEPTLKDLFYNIDKGKIEIAGSYRRGSPFSGDIDILISPKTLQPKELLHRYVESLIFNHILIDELALGPTKYMGVARINGKARRIDIRVVTREQWAAALLYFTGPKEFNTTIREYAKNLGYKLNEYGLYDLKTGKLVSTDSVQEIFNKLGLQFQLPQFRTEKLIIRKEKTPKKVQFDLPSSNDITYSRPRHFQIDLEVLHKLNPEHSTDEIMDALEDNMLLLTKKGDEIIGYHVFDMDDNILLGTKVDDNVLEAIQIHKPKMPAFLQK